MQIYGRAHALRLKTRTVATACAAKAAIVASTEQSVFVTR